MYNHRMGRLLSQPRTRLLAILALALIIRSLGLFSRPIWYDEAFSILFAQAGPSAMLSGTLASAGGQAAEEHPLAYYLMLWSWMRTFGSSLAAVRLFSMLAGVLSVGLLYLIARELFVGALGERPADRLGWLTALFGALAPFQVHYSQEIRMYAFLGLWLLLATFAFLCARRTRDWRWWALFALSAALAQYTHALAGLYLLTLALTPLLERDWYTLKAVMLAGFAAILLYLPWLVQLPAQFAKVSTSYWLARPGVEKLFSLLLVYVTNLPLPEGWLMPALGIALFALFLAVWQTFRAARAHEQGWKAGLWLLYLSFVPPLLSLLLSQWRPIFLERSFLASGAIFCIWLAWAFFGTHLPRPVQLLAVGGLAIAPLIGLYQHIMYSGFPYAPYDPLQGELRSKLQPGDFIIHSSKLSLLPSLYFEETLPQTYIADPPGSDVDTLAPVTQQVLGILPSPDIESAAHGRHRIWFVIFQQSIDEATAAGLETHPDLDWLQKHYRLDSVEDLGDLKLFRFFQ